MIPDRPPRQKKKKKNRKKKLKKTKKKKKPGSGKPPRPTPQTEKKKKQQKHFLDNTIFSLFTSEAKPIEIKFFGGVETINNPVFLPKHLRGEEAK